MLYFLKDLLRISWPAGKYVCAVNTKIAVEADSVGRT